MRLSPLLLLGLLLTGCQQFRTPNLSESVQLPEGRSTVLVTSSQNQADIKKQASDLGLEVQGDAVLAISGKKEDLEKLNLPQDKNLAVILDQRLNIADSDEVFAEPDAQVYYLAQKELGVTDFIKENPTYDGRGVIVGVIDDGISPHLSGFKTTTDGKPKFIHRATVSSLLSVQMSAVATESLAGFAKTVPHDGAKTWVGSFDESTRKPFDTPEAKGFDANKDGKMTVIDVAVIDKGGKYLVCVDANVNLVADSGECFGTFNSTGEYGFWSTQKVISVLGEFDAEKEKLTLSPGEDATDSHGEGVASVMAGHKIGGKFNGVAPGAQIFDYDFTGPRATFEESIYSVSSFTKALEYLGSKKVGVANISYSIFFESAATQNFMKAALENIVNKYNIVISFSAGNNGPGLGSLNRRAMYSETVLVAGAFVSKELDEYVHGVTGLPQEGRVIYYSSRGPGPEGGFGPLVISPLASLTHSSTGFGAFSGTSSASPALAGTAAVLISAIQQQGLKLDAATVVHAIRMSAQPLPGIPFIDQGYGLPNVGRALAIYKKMIGAELFTRVTSVMASAITGPDGIEARGLIFRTSANQATHENTVGLTAFASPLVDPAVAVEMVRPVLFKYSHSWIRGPSRLWVAVTRSNFSLSVNFDEMRKAVGDLNEVQGEVEVIDEATGLKIHTIPVTVIQPPVFNKSQEMKFEMGAEDAKRFHYLAPKGTKGLWLEVEGSVTYLSTLNVRVYNSSGTIVFSKSGKDMRNAMIPILPGHFQVGFSRGRGTELSMKVNAKITPVNSTMASEMVAMSAPAVTLDDTTDAMVGTLAAVMSPEVLSEAYASYTSATGFVREVPADSPGVYALTARLATASEMNNQYLNCMATLNDSNGVFVTMSATASITLKDGQKGTLKFVCYPFDHMDGSTNTLNYIVKVTRAQEKPEDIMALSTMIDTGRTKHDLKALKEVKAGQKFDLMLRAVGGSGEINLGTFTTF